MRAGLRAGALATGLVATAAMLGVVLSVRGGQAPAGPELAAIGSAIVGVSAAGVVAAVRPRGCNRLLSKRRPGRAETEAPPDLPCRQTRVTGHHVDCGRFASHVLSVAVRRLCAGCTGMALGGAVGVGMGLALAAGFFLLRGEWGVLAAVTGGASGAVGAAVAVGPRSPSPIARTLGNLALVAGGAVSTVVLASAGSAWGAFGLLALITVVGLRIEASRSRHEAICARCIATLSATSAEPVGARRSIG